MTLRNKGISALVVTCAFAMFAIAAIPTHAKAYSYYNGVDVSLCTDVFCGDFHYGDDYGYGGNVYVDGANFGFSYYEPVVYSYPTYTYTYPVIIQSPRQYRSEPDYFFRDWMRAGNEWDNQMNYYGGVSF